MAFGVRLGLAWTQTPEIRIWHITLKNDNIIYLDCTVQ